MGKVRTLLICKVKANYARPWVDFYKWFLAIFKCCSWNYFFYLLSILDIIKSKFPLRGQEESYLLKHFCKTLGCYLTRFPVILLTLTKSAIHTQKNPFYTKWSVETAGSDTSFCGGVSFDCLPDCLAGRCWLLCVMHFAVLKRCLRGAAQKVEHPTPWMAELVISSLLLVLAWDLGAKNWYILCHT